MQGNIILIGGVCNNEYFGDVIFFYIHPSTQPSGHPSCLPSGQPSGHPSEFSIKNQFVKPRCWFWCKYSGRTVRYTTSEL